MWSLSRIDEEVHSLFLHMNTNRNKGILSNNSIFRKLTLLFIHQNKFQKNQHPNFHKYPQSPYPSSPNKLINPYQPFCGNSKPNILEVSQEQPQSSFKLFQTKCENFGLEPQCLIYFQLLSSSQLKLSVTVFKLLT